MRHVAPQEGADVEATRRMNGLAAILKRKPLIHEDGVARNGEGEGEADAVRARDGDRKSEELETLLRAFEEDEVPRDRIVETAFDQPILSLLTQRKSFKMERPGRSE
jgi:hypothetical protein